MLNTLYHKIAIECAVDFRQSINRPELSINARISLIVFKKIGTFSSVVPTVYYTVVDNALRCVVTGKLDQNPGNFLSMLKVLANYDPVLRNHLEKPRQRNATYLSPHTQNELIDIIGKNIIQ